MYTVSYVVWQLLLHKLPHKRRLASCFQNLVVEGIRGPAGSEPGPQVLLESFLPGFPCQIVRVFVGAFRVFRAFRSGGVNVIPADDGAIAEHRQDEEQEKADSDRTEQKQRQRDPIP